VYPPESGGPATYTRALEEELPQHGFAVEVLAFRQVRHLPPVIRHIVFTAKIMGRARGVDIIYAQDPVSVGLPARIAAKLRGTRLLLKIVGDYAWEQGTARFGVTDTLDSFVHGTGTYPLPVRALKRIQHFVAAGAAGIVVPSKYLKGIVEAWGIGRERITVIYNGITLPAQGEMARDKNGPVIVSIARLVSWKGYPVLLDAFVRIQRTYPEATLFIVGDGPERDSLQEAIESRALTDSVRMTGALEREDALSYLRTASVFLLNTHYEGLSHTIIEAMACGVPVITTDIGGNPELIDNGVHGYLVSVDDAPALAECSVQLLRDTALRDRMGAHARSRASQFTRARMIEETAAYLRAHADAISFKSP
jgi:glycosyltransferase involved in cell wall biosynthesis